MPPDPMIGTITRYGTVTGTSLVCPAFLDTRAPMTSLTQSTYPQSYQFICPPPDKQGGYLGSPHKGTFQNHRKTRGDGVSDEAARDRRGGNQFQFSCCDIEEPQFHNFKLIASDAVIMPDVCFVIILKAEILFLC